MSPDPFQLLKDAVKDLEYPSESDAPFEVFQWPAGASSAQKQIAARISKGRKISQVSIDDFFGALSDSEDAPRFSQLRQTLESNLKNLKIFRAGDGEPKVDIYLIGQSSTGAWIALHATSTET